ncbi:MAG: hypothetical protein NVS4B7_11410 [Ktedonobacteraceae bacterium]
MNKHFQFSPETIQHLKQIQPLLAQLSPQTASQALIVPASPLPHSNIVVFPGSFNPPTNAHLALLEQAQQFFYSHDSVRPVQLYVALSRHIVDKEHVERPLLLDRIFLLQTILRHHLPHTGIMLFNRGLYVEQAQAIRASFPKVERVFFLMGFDKIVQILDPRYYDNRDAALHTLFLLAELLVAPRGKGSDTTLAELLQQPQNQSFKAYIHTLPFDAAYRDISSSQIRQHGGEYFHAMPQEVRRFMQETRATDYHYVSLMALKSTIMKNG